MGRWLRHLAVAVDAGLAAVSPPAAERAVACRPPPRIDTVRSAPIPTLTARLMRLLPLLLLLLAPTADAATIYLCKSYGGGRFWSSDHCQKRSALIERMVNVPDGMPFDQQVQLGRQAVGESERRSTQSTTTPAQTSRSSSTTSSGECAALEARIQALDAAARQPQSGASQDRIAAERRAVRERQFQLRC